MTPAELQERLNQTEKIVDQAKIAVVDACNICDDSDNAPGCSTCHVNKLIKMLKEWDK